LLILHTTIYIESMIKAIKSFFGDSKWNLAQKLEIEWWKHYLKKKDVQMYLDWKKKYWLSFLHQIQSEISFEKGTILDIGCGPAGIYMVLSDSEVIAIDPLINSYKKNISHYIPTNYPWVRFHSVRWEDFQSTTKANTIFCINAINHFTNINISLSVMNANLKSGGYSIITIDAHKRNWTKYLFSIIPADALHPHQYTRSQYISAIKETCPDWKLVHEKSIDEGLIFNYDLIIFQKN